MLWKRYFMMSQRIHVPRKNQIIGSKRKGHLAVRIFFVTDKIKKGNLKLSFCPTKNMLAELFTKGRQGNTLWKMRKTIFATLDKVDYVHRIVLKKEEMRKKGNRLWWSNGKKYQYKRDSKKLYRIINKWQEEKKLTKAYTRL